jgi:transcriptional regulator with XRE-family HTH domain
VRKEIESKFLKQIGKKLKSARIKEGLSIQRAAAYFKIKTATLDKIEAGSTNYNLTLFVKICKRYRIDPSDIMP